MSHGSLFTGIGLLDYGLTLAGLAAPRWVVERDDWRRNEILARRFPDAVRHDDVRTVGAHNLQPVRLVVGGFPCKGASTAGKRNGFDHPETVLWREMRRVVRELRPEFVVLENVANLLALHRGDVWGEVLGDMAALGFDVEWDCIPAAAVGAPHRRDRVFAVATHDEGGHQGAVQSPRRERAGWPGPDGGAEDAPDAGPSGRRQDVRDVRSGQPDAVRRGEAVADPEDRGGNERAISDGAASEGLEIHAWRDAVGRGIPVEWGSYGPAIHRWEAGLGRVAPEPLVRRVDDRSASRVERSRLSALGDGVQVQVGRLVGAHLLSIDPTLAEVH